MRQQVGADDAREESPSAGRLAQDPEAGVLYSQQEAPEDRPQGREGAGGRRPALRTAEVEADDSD